MLCCLGVIYSSIVIILFGLVSLYDDLSPRRLSSSALLHASVTQSQFIPLSTRNVSGISLFGGAALLQLHSSHIFYHIFSTISHILQSSHIHFYHMIHFLGGLRVTNPTIRLMISVSKVLIV